MYICVNTNIFYCIPLTFPDELDLCMLICSGFIKWYNECFSCCLYSAPLSVYTILHDGKYFITDFCTEWNIIIVTWINRRWSFHFIIYMWYKHFTFKHIQCKEAKCASILIQQKCAYYSSFCFLFLIFHICIYSWKLILCFTVASELSPATGNTSLCLTDI